MPETKNIKAVEIDKNHEKRFVIIDATTGELLDDAQGYGFKTAQKAYASYGYKNKLNGRKPANKAVIKAWIKKDPKHAKFIKHLDKVISNGFYPDDDDLTDYHGNWNGLSEDIMREVINKNLRVNIGTDMIKQKGFKVEAVSK